MQKSIYTFFSAIENPNPEEPTEFDVDSFEWNYIDEEPEDDDVEDEDEYEDEEEDSEC